MALQSLVKISSVNNLSDARYAAGMGVEMLGFDLDPVSDNFISPEQFNAITSWVSGVKLVGELGSGFQSFSHPPSDQYKLDYIQVDATVELSLIPEFHLPLIIKISQPDQSVISETLEKFAQPTAWFLLEPDNPMSNELLEWCSLQAAEYPIILGSNISVENVQQLLRSGFRGISLRGGHEIRPGYKDFDELADILEVLEVD